MSYAVRVLASAVLLAFVAAPGGATTFSVSLDTSALGGHPAVPFSLSFQLTDGDGTGNGDTTVSLSGFDFGGGSPAGAPALVGGASGSLAGGVVLTDTDFLNLFVQEFVPGAYVAFELAIASTFAPQAFPDLFSFAVLDSSGFELPYEGFFGAALVLDIAQPFVSELAATDATLDPFGGGGPIGMPPPVVTSAIPEPSALSLLALGLAGLAWRVRRHRGASTGRRR